jgi:hypothetical protein
MIEGEEFSWPSSTQVISEVEKNEFFILLKKYNPSWDGEERFDGVTRLDDFVCRTSQLLANPYCGIQMKGELEKIKRDLDYWKSMKEDQLIEVSSRIGKRMKLLTALPSSDKLKTMKDILINESIASL